MRQICNNLEIKPDLLTIDGDKNRTMNTADKARLDVSGVGVWGTKDILNSRIPLDVHTKRLS